MPVEIFLHTGGGTGTDHTFTPPEGVTRVNVLIVGAGGRTGFYSGGIISGRVGGGGGSGGQVRILESVEVSGPVSLRVGAGSSNTNTDYGYSSSFGAEVSLGGARAGNTLSPSVGVNGAGAEARNGGTDPGTEPQVGTSGRRGGNAWRSGTGAADNYHGGGGAGAGGIGIDAGSTGGGRGGSGVFVGDLFPGVGVDGWVGGGGGGGTTANTDEGQGQAQGGLGGGGTGAHSLINDGTEGVDGTGGGAGGADSTLLVLRGGHGVVAVSWTESLDCDPVPLDRLVYDIARRAGVPPGRIDVSALQGELLGYGIGRTASGRQQIELIQQYGFFDATDYRGMLQFAMRDRTPDGTIGGDDLAAHVFGEQRPSAAQRTRAEDYELPREVRVQYLQTEAEFEPGMQLYERRLTDAQGVADIDLTSIAMSADKAAAIAEISMLEAIVAREEVDFSLVATASNKALKPSDIKTLDVDGELQTIRLAQLDYAWPGVQAWKAVRHDPTIYASDAVGISSRLPRNPIVVPGNTTLELLDAPLVRLVDDASGYFAAMGGTPTVPGIIEGWPGGDLFRQEPSGLEDIARLTRPGSYFGSAQAVLADEPTTIRTAGPLVVSSSGPLASITLDALLLGGNLAALEVRSGGDRIGWEILQYQDAARDENTGQWTLTNLLRGRFGTEWAVGLHGTGDRFVTLPNVAQILTENDEIDLEREHRAATIGRDPENATPVEFAWTGVDRIPYSPVHLQAVRDTDVTFSWVRRDRVGNELVSGQTLPLSEASEAYEVDIYDTDNVTILRTLQVTTDEAVYDAADETTDFGSAQTEIDIAVYQMGALGRGYPARQTVTVE